MPIHRLVTQGLAINSYVVIDPSLQKAAVVDPTCDIQPILELLEREGASLSAILESHVHADFISGSKILKWALDGAPKIYCSNLGGQDWLPEYADVAVTDKFEIPLGSQRLQARHSPGHTPEHVMWMVFDDLLDPDNPIAAFTGDFLLIGSIGRPDLLGENEGQALVNSLYNSVFELLPRFPGNMAVFPAHGAGSVCGKGISSKETSTLAAERQGNMFLVLKDRKIWIREVLANMPPAPAYFKRVKQMNLKGPRLEKDLPEFVELSVEELAMRREKFFILDVREQEKFAAGYIAGAINIALAPSFFNWAALVIPYDTPLAVVAADRESLEQASRWLRVVGLDDLAATVVFDEEAKRGADYLSSFPIFHPIEVAELITEKGNGICIIDVRTSGEWQAGHIADSLHIEVAKIAAGYGGLPKDKRLGLVCGSGYRASIAASLLCKMGFKDVFNVKGGMQNWIKEGLPTV